MLFVCDLIIICDAVFRGVIALLFSQRCYRLMHVPVQLAVDCEHVLEAVKLDQVPCSTAVKQWAKQCTE